MSAGAARPSRRARMASRRLRVKVGEGFEVALGMAGRHARDGAAGGIRPGPVAGEDPTRLAERRVDELVRGGLTPFEAARGAVDAQGDLVLLPARHLAGPEAAARAAAVAQQRPHVVVEPAAGHEGRELGGRSPRRRGR